ncbi:hypothetical protein ABZ372_28815 [Streptomyces sp. NPDC005921]|uniref:hypothetical protein n=1 Tax=Streptomyces sp. NPDC005827 TaxID=3157070 RepID=UPI0033E98CBA
MAPYWSAQLASSSAVPGNSPGAAPRPTTPPAFVVEDGGYLSARWPGDAYLFARRYLDLLERPTGA